MRIMRWIGLGIALLLSATLVGGALFLRESAPQTDGAIQLPDLEAAVSVTRDSRGVPTIKAMNRHDLYVALGFVHAQDRLFQMDLQRRVGAGRLSEIFGATTLPTDRLMRTLGMYRHAEASQHAVSPEFRDVLLAYAAGVNAFIHSGNLLPPEFSVLNYTPDDWQPADTLVIGKLLAFQLSGNYRLELQRARLAQVLTADEVNSLYPDYPADAPITLRKLADATRGLPIEALLNIEVGDATPKHASNNWVVNGAHSVTGQPLLANDPHLDFAAPLIWYLAHLRGPDMDIVGGTTPGAPVVILGHNTRIAWGYTTTDADVEDLFIERSDATNLGRYATPDGTADFKIHRDMISVKGSSTEVLTIRETRHGPVISDILSGSPALQPETSLALQATFLSDDDRSVEAQWRIGLAQNWGEWQTALAQFVTPAQNMVYADIDGNIGFTVPGRIPIRKSGDGRAPVDGASGDHDWSGFIPFDALPRLFNPPSGRIATANNKIVPDDYPYFITRDWDAPFRIERIEAELAATPRQSIAASALLQADTLSLAATRLLPLMLAIEPPNARTATAIQLLKNWDRRFGADRPEPLIFAAWIRALNKSLFQTKLGTLYGASWSPSLKVTLNVLETAPSWCGDKSCPNVMAGALNDALDDLTARFGGEMGAWRWGEAHRAAFEHPLFSKIPVLRSLFNRHVPTAGAADTVNAGAFSPGRDNDPYADLHGPGFRAIYDLADLERSRFQLALGQSGHLLSGHYDDLQAGWLRNEGFPLPTHPRGSLLLLQPERSH